uniref:Uncharacterized protein n=1 Tax=Panagrolaimus sp. ES5 TaxID=591445 RepID=A0AC34GMW4_9BILA
MNNFNFHQIYRQQLCSLVIISENFSSIMSYDLMHLAVGAQLFNICVGAALGFVVLAQCGKKKDAKAGAPPSAMKNPSAPPAPATPGAPPVVNKDAEQKAQPVKEEKPAEEKKDDKAAKPAEEKKEDGGDNYEDVAVGGDAPPPPPA